MNRTLLLILVLIIAVAGLLALTLNTKPSPKPSIPVSFAQTVLVLSKPIASTSGTLSSNVYINTTTNSATAIQLELSYSTQDISNVDIKPGTFIKNPVELLKKIDTDNGRVSYALGAGIGQKNAKGTGIVAVLSFTKLKTSGTTTISFLPKTEVSSEGVSTSVLKSATGITFDLSK